MDGGAEVYLAFDFREVFVRKYADADGNEIVLDIYDMGSPAEAFGMFSCDRQDPEAGIGQGSEYGPGLLRFWRGRYFVSITVSGNEDKAEKAVLELGKAVAPLLGPDGAPPDMIKLLPAAGLQGGQDRLFPQPRPSQQPLLRLLREHPGPRREDRMPVRRIRRSARRRRFRPAARRPLSRRREGRRPRPRRS